MMLQFKLDENMDPRWGNVLQEAGSSVLSVADQQLQGTDDRTLAEVCREERRCLITADLDFAQSIEYPPGDYHGLVVLRHPKPTLAGMQSLVRQVAAAVKAESPVGSLWIVEPGRIRVHGVPQEEA